MTALADLNTRLAAVRASYSHGTFGQQLARAVQEANDKLKELAPDVYHDDSAAVGPYDATDVGQPAKQSAGAVR